MLLTGAAAGALAKWADFSSVQLLGDVFSELPIWILLGLVIARCSGSPGRAAAYAFVFFLAMIPAYYLAAEWMGGVWGITYVYGWAVWPACPPLRPMLFGMPSAGGWLPNLLSVLAAAAVLLSDAVVFRTLNVRGFCTGGAVRGAGVWV